MYFERIWGKNIGPFAEFDHALTRGSIGITGPNGTGKSTLLNLMFAVLSNDFGRFEGVKIDRINNQAGPKEASFVRAIVKHDEHTLDIYRSLRPARSELVVDGGAPVTNANKITEEIEAILGVSNQMLDLYAFKPQDKIYDFLQTTPAERADAYKVLCRTQKCAEVYDLLGAWLNKDAVLATQVTDNSDEISQALAECEHRIEELDEQIESVSKDLLEEDKEKRAREIVRASERLEDLQEERDTLAAAQAQLEETLLELTGRVAKRAVALREATQTSAQLLPKVHLARAAILDYERVKEQLRRQTQLREEAEQLEHEEAANARSAPNSELIGLDEEKLTIELTELKKDLRAATALLETFDEDGLVACPTCGTSVKDLQDHLAETRKTCKKAPARITVLTAQLAGLAAQRKERQAHSNWRAGFDARRKANQDALSSLGNLKLPKGDLEAQQQLVADYDAAVEAESFARVKHGQSVVALKQNETEIKVARERQAALSAAIAENTYAPERVQKARDRLDKHTAAKQQIAGLTGELKGVKRIGKDKQEELEKLRAKLAKSQKIAKMMAVVEESRAVVSWSRLPRRVATQNLARIEGGLNEWLEHFGSPFWVETDDNLSFVVHKPGEPPQPAGWLSTGQRVILALCFWPALGALWSKDLGILALDEPTANLDEENRKLLSQVLGRLTAKVRGSRQLIMVTHDHNLKTAFDQVIEL